MKIEGWLFFSGTFFFGAAASVYWLLSEEPTGTTALAVTAGFAFLVGFYVLFTSRRIDPRPEDRIDGEMDEGAGELGFFSPQSAWPLAVASSASTVGLGIIFGWWLVFLGVVLLGLSVIGFVFEYYRGEHAH